MNFTLFCYLLVSMSFANWQSVEDLVKAQENRLFLEAGLHVGGTDQIQFSTMVNSSSTRIYDLASLTKVVATASSVMILVDKGALSITDPIKKFIPEFRGSDKESVTVEDLLRHQAGLPSGLRPMASEAFLSYIKRVAGTPLEYKPRTKTIYSDLSAILLGHIVEVVSGFTLAEFAHENIYLPLGMTRTGFKPSDCVRTSVRADCRPHDPTAASLFPHSIGNAGLFSSLEDLSRFAQMVLKGGELDGVRVLSEKSLKAMTTISSGQMRGLGWDFLTEFSYAPRGLIFPAGISFGHTGYTGATIWIDPKSKSFYIFLSNRVLMGDDATRAPFSAFRRSLGTAIGKVIYARP